MTSIGKGDAGLTEREAKAPPQLVEKLFLGNDVALRAINAELRPFRLRFSPSADGVKISGDGAVAGVAALAIERIAAEYATGAHIDEQGARMIAIDAVQYGLHHDLAFRLSGVHRAMQPKSLSQVAFMDALLHDPHQILFGVGPTGTGKTHLAIAAGLAHFGMGHVKTIILTRPHVLLEGEVMTAALRADTERDAQLTPMMDELHDLIGHEEIERLTKQGVIQILPLGLMRGRTFNDAFVLVDEAQNMTVRNMRMILTRIGRGSRMVLTGDPAQVDLKDEGPSGLEHAMRLLEGSEIARVFQFERDHIVRNELVEQIEGLYQRVSGPRAREAA